MNQGAKILVTIGVIILFMLIFTPVTIMREEAGAAGPGIIGLILFAGLIGAIKAIWKNDNKEE